MENNENIIYKAKKATSIFFLPIVFLIISYGINKLLLLLAIPILIVYVLIYLTTILVITEDKIFGQTGIFNIHNVNALLEDITSVSIEKSFLGRIFDYGNIIINVYDKKIIFRDIRSPEKFRDIYYDLVS